MPVTKENSLLLKKAREVLLQTEKLVEYLQTNNLEEPDFSSSTAPTPGNNEYESISTALGGAARDLTLLSKGPIQWLRGHIGSMHDLCSWQTALHFKYFTRVSLDGPTHVKDLAAAAGMDEDRTTRIMRHLASMHCFEEVEPGVFVHTALSATVARNPDLEANVGFQLEEMFEAGSAHAASVEKAPFSVSAADSAFNLRFGIYPYEYWAANPDRGARFALAMAGYVKMNRDYEQLRDRFPWTSLEKKTVVDVGGGSGHVSMYLANQFPDLNFIVQDVSPEMLSQGPKLPEFELVDGRISFMQYSFYDPQPIADAGLFILRQVIHNYTDDVCVKIFKSFVPALEKCGSETGLLINDMILPAFNEISKAEEYHLRQIDIAMMTSFVAKQRTLEEFTKLLKEADQRFEIYKVHGKGVMGLIEARLSL